VVSSRLARALAQVAADGLRVHARQLGDLDRVDRGGTRDACSKRWRHCGVGRLGQRQLGQPGGASASAAARPRAAALFMTFEVGGGDAVEVGAQVDVARPSDAIERCTFCSVRMLTICAVTLSSEPTSSAAAAASRR
jgi:hypothetical protein